MRVPEERQADYAKLGEKSILLKRYLPRIYRHSPAYAQEFTDTVLSLPFEDMARYAYRVLEKDPSKFTLYVETLRSFYQKSPWIAQLVAENFFEVIDDEEKTRRYIGFVERSLTINEWIAGEVADVLAPYMEQSDDLETFWKIIIAFSKAQKQWIAVEGIGYVVDGLQAADDKEAFLREVLSKTLEDPKEGAMFARGWKKGVDTIEKRDGVVHIDPAYDRLTHWEEDPKGHFNIAVIHDEDIIEARYYTNKQELKIVFTGKRAFNIYNKIHDLKLVSRYDHASWLGHELTRAEIALREGIEFRQDRVLNFSKKWK